MKKISFITLVFLLVLQSFIGPIATSANTDISSPQVQSFTFGEVTVGEDGKASIPWVFVAGNVETEVVYTDQSELKLDNPVSGNLTGGIGTYEISVDGLITVIIKANQGEETSTSGEIEVAALSDGKTGQIPTNISNGDSSETTPSVTEEELNGADDSTEAVQEADEENRETETDEEKFENPETDEVTPVDGTELTSTGTFAPLATTEITENIITSVIMKNEAGEDITVVRPDQGSRVTIDLTWELPKNHGYTDGATFTFNLPDKFKITTELTGDLSGGWGTFIITPTGQVTFTFNEEIEDTPVTNGYFKVWREFEESKFSGGLEQPIEFNLTGIAVINVHFNSKTNEKISKSATKNKGMNTSEVDWVVDFNKGEDSISNAVFKDNLPAGLSLEGQIEVFKLEVDLAGNVIGETPDSTFAAFPIDLGNIDSAYRIKYKTNVNVTTNQTFTNTASISGDNYPAQTDSVNIPVKFSEPLNKKSTGYKQAGQTIDWLIQYNFNEQSITQTDAWITDTFDATTLQQLKGDIKVYKVDINDDGNPINKQEVSNFILTPNGTTGFEIHFTEDINNAYEIVYTTEAVNRVYGENITVANNIEIHNKTTTASRTIGQYIFHKSNGVPNYTSKEIEWTIHLNRDAKSMENVVINDNFAGQNMVFLPETLTVNGVQIKDSSAYTLSPDTTYDIGFQLSFNNTISTSQVIKYKTKFDPTKAVPSGGYKNNAKVNWKENSVSQTEISKSGTVTPDNYTTENGNKTGVYNAETKEITWTIDVNYNLYSISNAIIKDFYTGPQSFVEGSLKVHHLTLQGGENQVQLGAEVPITSSDLSQPIQNAALDDGFELRLGQINSAYRITYKTSLKGEPVKATYTNQATLQDGTGPYLFEKSAKVKPKHGEEYVSKSGRQGSGVEADIAFWTVDINRSQSIISANSVLTDTLTANQILLADSFKIYKTTVSSNGTVAKSNDLLEETEYTLDIVGNSFTLTFLNEIETAYVLEYQSFINAVHGETISNEAKFQGQSSGTMDQNDNESIVVVFAGAGGGANAPGKGDLKIIKKDSSNGELLPGAVFELWNKAGDKRIAGPETTKGDGEVIFEQLKYIDYQIREISPPTGYLIDQAIIETKDNKFTDTNNEYTITNTKIRQAIELLKTDAGGSPLSGVVFELQKKSPTGEYENVTGYEDKLTTDSSGKIYVGDDLVPGEYQLVEKTAKDNSYYLDQTPVNYAAIVENQTAVESKTMVNYKQGNIVIKKTDKDGGSPLPGAVFTLNDKDDETKVLYTSSSSDSEGLATFTNVKYGEYIVKELTAPVGFVGATGIPNITVNDSTNFLLTNVAAEIVENEKIHQAVTLTKVDEDTDEPLAGAEFKLYNSATEAEVTKNADNEDITVAELTTDTTGKITINNLPAGSYYFKEVKAPQYYLLPTNEADRQTANFTIEPDQTDMDDLGQITNKRGTGDIVITKVDAANNSILIDGVVFELSKDGVLVETQTTANGLGTFSNLEYGTYTLVETRAHSDYLLDSTVKTIVLDSEAGTDGKIKTLTVENTKTNRAVTLTKYNSNKSLKLKNAIFELQKATGSVDASGNSIYEVVAGIDVEKLTTDENGEINLKDMPVGSYQLVETKAPAGYRLDKTPVNFVMTQKQTATILVEKLNARIPSEGGGGTPPINPGDPNNPGNPGDPNNPGNPGDPNNPGDPGDPNNPGNPGDPNNPGNSGNPNNPGTSGDPNNPGSPGGKNPSNPGDPNNPETPSNTGNPNNSGTPEHSKNSINQGPSGETTKPNNPATGEKLLPQTGEAYSLGMLFTGIGSILVGFWLMFNRRKTSNV